jgi:hypothetical protein
VRRRERSATVVSVGLGARRRLLRRHLSVTEEVQQASGNLSGVRPSGVTAGNGDAGSDARFSIEYLT